MTLSSLYPTAPDRPGPLLPAWFLASRWLDSSTYERNLHHPAWRHLPSPPSPSECSSHHCPSPGPSNPISSRQPSLVPPVFGCLGYFSPLHPTTWPLCRCVDPTFVALYPPLHCFLLFCAQPWVGNENAVSRRKDSLKPPTDLSKVVSPPLSPGRGQSRCHRHSGACCTPTLYSLQRGFGAVFC